MLGFKMVFITPKRGQGQSFCPQSSGGDERWTAILSKRMSELHALVSHILPQELRDGNAGLATGEQPHMQVES